jgi:hypothetical protein
MVLSPGGPTTHGKWFFTGIAPYPNRHTFGSLNYYKGNTEAVFSGVGEVARGHWRDGSEVLCTSPPPAPVCFTGVYGNFDIVEISFDGGFTYVPLSGTAGDNAWAANITVSGHLWQFHTTCGNPIAGAAGLEIVDPVSGHYAFYPSDALVTAYPATWHFSTVAASPVGWGGGFVLVRTRCSGTSTGFAVNGSANAANITVSLSIGQLPGDTYYLAYFQNGTDVSGGVLPVPTISGGWTSVFAATSKRSYLWSIAPGTAGVSATVGGVSAADLQSLYLVGNRSRPGGGIIASLFKQAQGAATALSSGAVTFTGDQAFLYSLFVQTRDAATFQAAPVFSAVGGGFISQHTDTRQATGATPVFETKADILVERGPSPAGSYTATLTSSRSLGWDSMIFAAR